MDNTVSSKEGVAETFKKARENKIVIESSKNQIKENSKKSASAFRTISEVAHDINVQQHVLRFWETKFSQIKPLKRGGGRRFYRPEDVLIIKKIHNLLYTQGYTIKGVQKLLKGQSKTQIIKDEFGKKKEISPSNDDKISTTAQKPEVKIEKVIVKEIVEIEKRSLSEQQKSSLLNVLNDLKSIKNELLGKTPPIFE